MTTHQRLLFAARRRHWVLTTTELVSLGLTKSTIRHCVACGLLHRVHIGVFAVGRPELAPEGLWLAAVHTQREAAVAERSAAAAWAILGARPGPVHVAVPTQAGHRPRQGVVVHRCDRLTPGDVIWRNGIPVTTLAHTLRDIAGILDARGLTRAIRQAERLHRIDLVRLHRAMGPARPGAVRENRLRKALEAYVPGDVGEGLEETFLELCVRFGLPIPVGQLPIGRFRADFAWPNARLVVETDDRASHDTWSARQEDRVKDRALTAAGWEVMRFTWAEISREPAMVAREIRAALDRRRSSVVPATPERL